MAQGYSEWAEIHPLPSVQKPATHAPAGPQQQSPSQQQKVQCGRVGPLSFLINFPHPSNMRNRSSFVLLGLCRDGK